MKKLLTLGLLAFAAFSAEGYKVLNKIKVGGTGGWDYLSVDPVTQRIFASHGGIVEVVDIKAGKVVGQITQLHGVHGIAVASVIDRTGRIAHEVAVRAFCQAPWKVDVNPHFRCPFRQISPCHVNHINCGIDAQVLLFFDGLRTFLSTRHRICSRSIIS